MDFDDFLWVFRMRFKKFGNFLCQVVGDVEILLKLMTVCGSFEKVLMNIG